MEFVRSFLRRHLARNPVHGSVAKIMSAVFSGYLLSAGLNDNTRIDFQISFNPDWQIDDGFLKGQS